MTHPSYTKIDIPANEIVGGWRHNQSRPQAQRVRQIARAMERDNCYGEYPASWDRLLVVSCEDGYRVANGRHRWHAVHSGVVLPVYLVTEADFSEYCEENGHDYEAAWSAIEEAELSFEMPEWMYD